MVEGEPQVLSSTSIMGGSQAGSSVLAMPQSGSSLKSNKSGLRLPLSPSGQTIWPPHCSSCHTCNWCRYSCWVSHQSWCQCATHWTKVLGPWHYSSWNWHIASWYLCWPATLAFRPPLPEWVGRLGKDASTWLLGQRPAHTQWPGLALLKWMSYPGRGFSTSPQAPTWERAVNCLCMTVHTQNCITTGQKLSDLHVALVDGSHKLILAVRSKKLLIVITVCN